MLGRTASLEESEKSESVITEQAQLNAMMIALSEGLRKHSESVIDERNEKLNVIDMFSADEDSDENTVQLDMLSVKS